MTPDNKTIEHVTELGNALRARGWTVSCAESCTGGGIAYALTSIAGSSDWFNQSWVTYSNEAKMRALGVTSSTLKTFGAVSQQTVEEMALGVRDESNAELVVTVSGIAGPGGGTKEKPVGTVWFGFLCGKSTQTIERVFTGERISVRKQAINFAITHLSHLLHEHDV